LNLLSHGIPVVLACFAPWHSPYPSGEHVAVSQANPEESRFRISVPSEGVDVEGVFVDVLVLCAAAGLTSLGTIDGTKMGADAIRAEVAAILAEAGTATGPFVWSGAGGLMGSRDAGPPSPSQDLLSSVPLPR
jgi:hypothetical protein